MALIVLAAFVLFALTGISAAALLPACGVRSWLSPRLLHCPEPVAVDATLAAARARQAELEAEVAALERALAGLPCPEDLAAAEPEPDAIDEARWDNRDLGLLEGCWQLDSDYSLRHEITGEPVTVTEWEACFDGAGTGSQSIAFTDGVQCEGPIYAAFNDGGALLLQDRRDVPCNRGIYVTERETVCQLDSQQRAVCQSGNAGAPTTQNVRLRR